MKKHDLGTNVLGQIHPTMTNHVFCDIDRYMSMTIMHSNGMTYHLGEDRACPTPGAQELSFRLWRSYLQLFLNNFGSMKGPFLNDRDIFLNPFPHKPILLLAFRFGAMTEYEFISPFISAVL